MWLNAIAPIHPLEETQIATQKDGQGFTDATRNVHSEKSRQNSACRAEALHIIVTLWEGTPSFVYNGVKQFTSVH